MSENRRVMLDRWVMFVATLAIGCLLSQVAEAQVLRFLSEGTRLIKEIINHEIWPIGLAVAVLMELYMFGHTKNKMYLIAIVPTGLILGAWVARNEIIGYFAPGVSF